jgi:hypothetical protein
VRDTINLKQVLSVDIRTYTYKQFHGSYENFSANLILGSIEGYPIYLQEYIKYEVYENILSCVQTFEETRSKNAFFIFNVHTNTDRTGRKLSSVPHCIAARIQIN